MSTRIHHERPMWIARTAGGLVILTGLVGLCGWAFDIARFKSVYPDLPAMVPSTAFCFVLAGITLWCVSVNDLPDRKPASLSHRLSQIGASAILLVGVLKLSEYLTGWNLGIDTLLFPNSRHGSNPPQMAVSTAIDFLLLGIAILLVGTRRFAKTFQIIILSGAILACLGVSRYVFGGASFTYLNPMAVHAAGAFLLLNAGALCLRADAGAIPLLVANDAGGQTMRRLLVPMLFLVLLMNWLEPRVESTGWFNPATTKSLFMASDLVIFGGLIWLNAARLHRSDTERRSAQETLRQSQERTRAIVESSDDAIISKTLDGIVTSWNRGAEKIFGYSAGEVIGKPMLMLFPPARVSEERDILGKIARGGLVDHFETVRVRKDGRLIDVSVTLSPLRDPDGKITGIAKIARDITEQKRAEQKLQMQLFRLDLLNRITRAIGEHQDLQSIYQVVVGSLEDDLPVDFACICAYDRATTTLTVTTVGAKSGPLALELAMPQNSRIPIDSNGLSRCVHGDLVYEPDIHNVRFPFPERLARGGLRSLVIIPLSVESEIFGVVVAARREPNTFSSGDCEFLRQLSGHTALAAHQARLNSALQTAYDDLRQTQQAVMQQERLRALGEMASGIAHDINNSLSPVMLYTGFLLEREPGLSAAARGHLEVVQRAVSDVADTIARLKEFYRQREPQLEVAPVQLNDLIQQVVDLTRARWSDMPQQRGIAIELRTDLTCDLPLVTGAESEIREALINLVFNAVDAMPKGGTLSMRTRMAGRNSCIEIADTGTGMDEETRRRCLEPFFTTKGDRGTGLGLAMVFGIMQRHNGDLEIESEPGKGTTIRLAFPVASSATNGPAQMAATASVLPRLRLLVVDDDPLLLKALRDILEADGHLVVTANGGQAGIDTFKMSLKGKESFAVVFTDLGMPHVDGRAVASAVKLASPGTPVILLTGWGKRLVSDGDIPPHVNYVLSKPPKPSELREALARCVSTG